MCSRTSSSSSACVVLPGGAGREPHCTQAVLTLAPAPLLPFLPAAALGRLAGSGGTAAGARGTFATIAVPLAEHGDRLLWAFEIERTHFRSALVPSCLASEWEGGGVGFEAAFESDRGDRTAVAPWRAVSGVVRGEFRAPMPGKLLLMWDNAQRRLTRKSLCYVLELRKAALRATPAETLMDLCWRHGIFEPAALLLSLPAAGAAAGAARQTAEQAARAEVGAHGGAHAAKARAADAAASRAAAAQHAAAAAARVAAADGAVLRSLILTHQRALQHPKTLKLLAMQARLATALSARDLPEVGAAFCWRSSAARRCVAAFSCFSLRPLLQTRE